MYEVEEELPILGCRWKADVIAYNPAIEKFAPKCNPDLLRIFFFDKAGKKYLAYKFSGVHFRLSLPQNFLFASASSIIPVSILVHKRDTLYMCESHSVARQKSSKESNFCIGFQTFKNSNQK